MNFVKPTPLGASKVAISKFAEDAARRLDYRIGEDMWAFVSRLGGRISFREMILTGKDYPESMIVQPNGDFHIFLSTVTTTERDRFTIAHELGHLFLHFPIIKQNNPSYGMIATRQVDENDDEQRRAEWEANCFAASFLMPEDIFRNKKNDIGQAALAKHFGVSQMAADVRIRTLGII